MTGADLTGRPILVFGGTGHLGYHRLAQVAGSRTAARR